MTIDSFSGEHSFLSNFHPSIVKMSDTYGFWVSCSTVEHAFQAAKARLQDEFMAIAEAPTPGRAKRLGRKCTLVADWEFIKVPVMNGLLRQKFTNPHLAEALRATMDHHLIEGNNWGDTFWGVCNGRGRNVLGQLLMDIRSEL